MDKNPQVLNDYFYHRNLWVVHFKRFWDFGDLFECQKPWKFWMVLWTQSFKHTIWTKIDVLANLNWQMSGNSKLANIYIGICLWGLNRQMSGLAFVYLNWRMSSRSLSIGACPVGECLIGVYGYTEKLVAHTHRIGQKYLRRIKTR